MPFLPSANVSLFTYKMRETGLLFRKICIFSAAQLKKDYTVNLIFSQGILRAKW
jgi:hypothetical protein